MQAGSQMAPRATANTRAMADSLLVIYGIKARGMTLRHVARCLELKLIDDVEFWLRVRNRIDWLLRTVRRAGDTVQ
jgi:hypothetical protein